MRDEPLGVEQQPTLRYPVRREPPLHRLDQALVLSTDEDVEIDHVADHLGGGVGTEEVLGDNEGPLGRNGHEVERHRVVRSRVLHEGEARPEKAELPGVARTGGIVGEIGGAPLGPDPQRRARPRPPPAGLERVADRVDGQEAAEARMRDGAVIALVEVLDDDLPVCLDHPFAALDGYEGREVETVSEHAGGHLPEAFGERRGVGRDVGEDEGAEAVHSHGLQAEVGSRETLLAL